MGFGARRRGEVRKTAPVERRGDGDGDGGEQLEEVLAVKPHGRGHPSSH